MNREERFSEEELEKARTASYNFRGCYERV